MYDKDYFDWQKDIGAFGGIANLFKFSGHLLEADTVLDFGCGGGFLLNQIVAKERWGVDVNPVAIKHAQSLAGINAVDTIDKLPNSYFDKVISNHALEHVINPLEVLKALKTKMKRHAEIIFVVPHDCISQKYRTDDVNMHLYTWNCQTLGNLFSHAGFTITSVSNLQHQWPYDYVDQVKKYGWDKFHKNCRLFAQKNNTYQIKIVASNEA